MVSPAGGGLLEAVVAGALAVEEDSCGSELSCPFINCDFTQPPRFFPIAVVLALVEGAAFESSAPSIDAEEVVSAGAECDRDHPAPPPPAVGVADDPVLRHGAGAPLVRGDVDALFVWTGGGGAGTDEPPSPRELRASHRLDFAPENPAGGSPPARGLVEFPAAARGLE